MTAMKTLCASRRRWQLVLGIVMMFGLLATACGDDDSAENFEKVSNNLPGDRGSAASSGDGVSDDGGEVFAAEAPAEAPEPASEPVPADEPAPAPEPAPAEESADSDRANAAQGDDSADGGGADQPSNPVTPVLQPDDLGRSIIRVASLSVTAENVTLAASQAKTAIAGLGGLVFGEQTTTGDRDETVLEFKVRPNDFDEALNRLRGVGELESQQITADDVTERVVDLQSRITTAAISVDRLRDLLVGASALETIAGLEQQLLQRETDLETLRGQLRTIEGQVDLATIFLTLREPVPPAPPPVEPKLDFEVTFAEGADNSDRCPGVDELDVDEGDAVTICVQLTNSGNTDIGEIELRESALDLGPRDFTFIDAESDLVLKPEEQVTVWASATAPSGGTARIDVSAVPFDSEGERLRVNTEFVNLETYRLSFIENDALPGFTDALSGSWDVFKTVIGVIVVVAGAIVPFIWIPILVVAGRLWWVRRDKVKYEAYVAEREGSAPLPD